MGTNLGKLLADAGVKGAKLTPPPLTVEDLRAVSRNPPAEVHTQEAMNRLPTEFLPLLEVNDAGDFVEKLRGLLENDWRWEGTRRIEVKLPITIHVVYGLVQLVHYHRDRLSGSRRKGFDRLIPKFLKMKKRLEKNPPADLRSFIIHSL